MMEAASGKHTSPKGIEERSGDNTLKIGATGPQLTLFAYTESQRRALAAAIQPLPRVLDERPGLDPWIPFLYVAHEVRSALRRTDAISPNEYAEDVRKGRHLLDIASEQYECFKSESDDALAMREAWVDLEIPIPWSQATETLFWIKQFISIIRPEEYGSFIGASRTKLTREYYYWLLGAWAALGGRFTYTRRLDNTIDGPLVRYLRAAADPVLKEYALKPSSLKHVITDAKQLQPISPIRTRPRRGGAATLWRGYKGPVIVTFVHMRGHGKRGISRKIRPTF